MAVNVVRMTDEDGQVVAAREYDAFGNVLSETGDWSISDLGFHSNWMEMKDSGGNLCLTPSGRVYDTRIGRFLQRDPVGDPAWVAMHTGAPVRPPKAEPWKRTYGFAESNPLTAADPSGLTDCSDFIDNVMDAAERINVWWHGPDYFQRLDLTVWIACAYLPSSFRWVYVVPGTCPNPYENPTGAAGFCPQLSQGGQDEQLYRHLAFSMSAKLQGTTFLSEFAESRDCGEVRESCGCECPPSKRKDPSRACLQDQAEVIGDILGREAGRALKKYMNDQITGGAARAELSSLLCGGDCGQNADHCCQNE